LILPTTDYTATNDTSVTLVSGAAAGDILDFLAYATGTMIQLPIDLATSVTGTLPPSSGGTGTTGTPSNGQLLIGNGTTYSTASLTQGTGISVTNGSGSITLANTGVTSVVAGTGISVSGATGAVTISSTGGGTVTSVATGNGLTGGTITSSGTISLDFYTGSDVNNTSYPIGSYLVTSTSSGSLTRNASASLGYATAGGLAATFVPNSGTLISGTWRARGTIDGASGNLFQRTA
jgi:hypothetical protein